MEEDKWFNAKLKKKPPANEPVFIFDEFYYGVTLGSWTGKNWETLAGSDDIFVSWWMPINWPEPPKK